MSETQPREIAQNLLSEASTLTIATASPDGEPEAATILFAADEEFAIYFNTATSYRKYDNLAANPRVAVVVDGDRRNVQLEGPVTELTGSAAADAQARLQDKYGEVAYHDAPDSVFFKLTPDWIRVLVDSTYPPEYAMVRGDGPVDAH